MSARSAAAEKKAEDVVVLDLRGISTFTDYYVICSGNSEPQIKAIAAEIQEQTPREARDASGGGWTAFRSASG